MVSGLFTRNRLLTDGQAEVAGVTVKAVMAATARVNK